MYNARLQSDKHTLNVTTVPTHYLYASADAEGGYFGSTPFMDSSPPPNKTSNKTNKKKADFFIFALVYKTCLLNCQNIYLHLEEQSLFDCA